MVPKETAYGHCQHAGAGLQHAACAASAAFDEILDGIAPGEHHVHVFIEHGGVQRVVLETAAHKERPATAQDRADNGHVEIDPCGDVRRHQAILVKHVGQQQVVDV